MNSKLQINNQFLKIITDKSVISFLEDNGIEATEGKTLNNQYETIVRFSVFNKRDVVKKVKALLEAL